MQDPREKKNTILYLSRKKKKNLTKSNDIDAYHGNNTRERTQATPTLIRVPYNSVKMAIEVCNQFGLVLRTHLWDVGS